jgi:SnoaL-like domain
MSRQELQTVRGTRTVLRPLSGRASQRRSLDERLSVRFPALYRRLADAFMRLSSRSRLRRSAVARRVQRAYAAANRRDFDLVLLGWDAGSQYRPSADLMPPDVEPVFHGHDGMRQLWRYWLDAFEDIRWEPEEILDFGDSLPGHRSTEGTRVRQRRRRQRAGVPAVHAPPGLGASPGGLPGSLGGPRRRPARGVARRFDSIAARRGVPTLRRRPLPRARGWPRPLGRAGAAHRRPRPPAQASRAGARRRRRSRGAQPSLLGLDHRRR